jgi:hypothetical protein
VILADLGSAAKGPGRAGPREGLRPSPRGGVGGRQFRYGTKGMSASAPTTDSIAKKQTDGLGLWVSGGRKKGRGPGRTGPLGRGLQARPRWRRLSGGGQLCGVFFRPASTRETAYQKKAGAPSKTPALHHGGGLGETATLEHEACLPSHPH